MLERLGVVIGIDVTTESQNLQALESSRATVSRLEFLRSRYKFLPRYPVLFGGIYRIGAHGHRIQPQKVE